MSYHFYSFLVFHSDWKNKLSGLQNEVSIISAHLNTMKMVKSVFFFWSDIIIDLTQEKACFVKHALMFSFFVRIRLYKNFPW